MRVSPRRFLVFGGGGGGLAPDVDVSVVDGEGGGGGSVGGEGEGDDYLITFLRIIVLMSYTYYF